MRISQFLFYIYNIINSLYKSRKIEVIMGNRLRNLLVYIEFMDSVPKIEIRAAKIEKA